MAFPALLPDESGLLKTTKRKKRLKVGIFQGRINLQQVLSACCIDSFHTFGDVKFGVKRIVDVFNAVDPDVERVARLFRLYAAKVVSR